MPEWIGVVWVSICARKYQLKPIWNHFAQVLQYNNCMKTHAKRSVRIDGLNLTPEAEAEVSNLIQSLLTQAQNELKLLEAKNQALTLELAHLRRIRFGAKSEALSQPHNSACSKKTGKPMWRR